MRWIDLLARDRSTTAGRAARALLLAAVTLAIVGAQWVGLVHRVEHGGAAQWPAAFVGHFDPQGGAETEHRHGEPLRAGQAADAPFDPEHDCAALDALTAADALRYALPAPRAIAPPACRPAAVAQCQPGRLAASPFRARGPPVFS
jgi:hypothetical protein